MAWKPTPKAERINVKRYDRATGEWTDCAFSDLRTDDLYASFAHDGTQLAPDTAEPAIDDRVVARALMDARRSEGRGYGYEAMVLVETLEFHLSALAN